MSLLFLCSISSRRFDNESTALPDLPKDWRCKGVAELLYSHLLLLTPLYDGGDDDLYGVAPAVATLPAPLLDITSVLGLPIILNAIGLTSSYPRGTPRDMVPRLVYDDDDDEYCCWSLLLPCGEDEDVDEEEADTTTLEPLYGNVTLRSF